MTEMDTVPGCIIEVPEMVADTACTSVADERDMPGVGTQGEEIAVGNVMVDIVVIAIVTDAKDVEDSVAGRDTADAMTTVVGNVMADAWGAAVECMRQTEWDVADLSTTAG